LITDTPQTVKQKKVGVQRYRVVMDNYSKDECLIEVGVKTCLWCTYCSYKTYLDLTDGWYSVACWNIQVSYYLCGKPIGPQSKSFYLK